MFPGFVCKVIFFTTKSTKNTKIDVPGERLLEADISLGSASE
jgi:hypothetical protein